MRADRCPAGDDAAGPACAGRDAAVHDGPVRQPALADALLWLGVRGRRRGRPQGGQLPCHLCPVTLPQDTSRLLWPRARKEASGSRHVSHPQDTACHLAPRHVAAPSVQEPATTQYPTWERMLHGFTAYGSALVADPDLHVQHVTWRELQTCLHRICTGDAAKPPHQIECHGLH